MAQTVEQIRSKLLTSIFGRRLGLTSDDYLGGAKANIVATQVLTSADSTGTSIPNYGITSLALTTLATTVNATLGTTEVGFAYKLDAPKEGVRKTLYMATGHSTAAASFTCGADATVIWATFGSTFTGVNFIGKGQTCTLVGVSTSKWLVETYSSGTSFASSN